MIPQKFGSIQFGADRFGGGGQFGVPAGDWATLMLESYQTIHGALAESVADELFNRCKSNYVDDAGTGYYFQTFGPPGLNKEDAEWILLFLFHGNIVAKLGFNGKTGDDPRWNFDGIIEAEVDPEDLPAHTLGTGAGIMTVSSTDGFSGVNDVRFEGNSFEGAFPRIGSIPNFALTNGLKTIYLSGGENNWNNSLADILVGIQKIDNGFNFQVTSCDLLEGNISTFASLVPVTVSSMQIRMTGASLITGDVAAFVVFEDLRYILLGSTAITEVSGLMLHASNNNINWLFLDDNVLDINSIDNALLSLVTSGLITSKAIIIKLEDNVAPSLAGYTNKLALEGLDWAGGGGSIAITVDLPINLMDGFDFEVGWMGVSGGLVLSPNEFDSDTDGGGITKGAVTTIGKNYLMYIEGTNTDGDFQVRAGTGLYKDFGAGAFDEWFIFRVAADEIIYLRTSGDEAIVQVNQMELYEISEVDILNDFNFNNWTLVNAIVNDADTFTATANGGNVSKPVCTTGKRYVLRLAGTISAGAVSVWVSAQVLPPQSGTFDTEVVFTALVSTLRIEIANDGAHIDVTKLELYQLD